jgi:hypothetical protein
MQQFSLYDIYALEIYSDCDAFDKTRLPLEITGGVRIEDVEPLLKKDTFEFVTPRMGTHAAGRLEKVKYALVHRFDLRDGPGIGLDEREKQKSDSEMLVRNIAACLRLIRPMRQFALSMSGTIREDGTFDVRSFDTPIELMETPENQKLFHLRNRDADDLRKYAPLFLRAMNDYGEEGCTNAACGMVRRPRAACRAATGRSLEGFCGSGENDRKA